jgi:ABC-type antimicrobial peptide transport system permease subunit
MIARGGFSVTAAKPVPNPWTLLQSQYGDKIPVLGDANSVEWNLHSGLNESYSMPGADGKPVAMIFTGLIPDSIFASELLMSEDRFRRIYPSITEPRYFLIDVPKDRETAVAEALRRNLGRMGLEVRSTREVLNAYTGVQNTYLSIFLALGGLGLILGTVGLVTVLLRSALERRKEFALMLAQGFSTDDLFHLLLAENIGLLVAGLTLGAVSALAAVAPGLSGVDTHVNWISIIVLFAGIFLIGLASCAVTARRVVAHTLVEALREE